MIFSFRQYLLEATDTKTGNYVQVRSKFPDFLSELSVDSGKVSKDPHITLVYSKESSVDKDKLLDNVRSKFKEYGIAKITSADKFDSQEDDSLACIVLKLDAPLLRKINSYIITVGDIKHSYDEFEPHLTLFYDVKKEEAEYWVDYINRKYTGEVVHFKGFDSKYIIKDWNK